MSPDVCMAARDPEFPSDVLIGIDAFCGMMTNASAIIHGCYQDQEEPHHLGK